MDNLRVNGTLHVIVASTCGYELTAFASRGRLPTVTALCAGRPWLAGLVLGVLSVDLLYKNPRRPAIAR